MCCQHLCMQCVLAPLHTITNALVAQALQQGVLPATDTLIAVPNTLMALCLNTHGLAKVKDSQVLRCLIPVFTTKTYVKALQVRHCWLVRMPCCCVCPLSLCIPPCRCRVMRPARWARGLMSCCATLQASSRTAFECSLRSSNASACSAVRSPTMFTCTHTHQHHSHHHQQQL